MPGIEAEYAMVQQFMPTITLEEVNQHEFGAHHASQSRRDTLSS